MTETDAPPLTVRQPGEGAMGGLVPGLGVVWKLDTEHTNGLVSIVEHPFEVGALVPPHIHHREDEYSMSPRDRLASARGTARSFWAPAGTSPSPATRSMRCGMPETYPRE
jgi:hypothetical protein